jgi:acyl-CoA hydrolase
MSTIMGVLDTAGTFVVQEHCSIPLRNGTLSPAESSQFVIPPIVTAAANRIDFINPPAKKFNHLTTEATITHRGERSFEVEIEISHADPMARQPEKIPMAKGFLTFVLTGKSHASIPGLNLSNDKVRKDNEAGIIRKQFRIQENRSLRTLAEPEAFQVDLREADFGTVITLKTSPMDANRFDKVFGATTLDLLYRAGKKAATRYAETPVYGIRMDRMNFARPGTIGQVLKACPVVVRTLNQRQVEVQVDLRQMTPLQALHSTVNRFIPSRFLPADQSQVIASCFLVFEPQNPDLKVPKFIPRTPKEALRRQAATIRDEIREAEELAIAAIK